MVIGLVVVLVIIVIVLVVAANIFAWNHDNKLWNKGRCKECNNLLKFSNVDSMGNRIYLCSKYRSHNHVTIIYPLVDTEYWKD